MEYKKVLITGCGGMVGNAISPYFKERCPQVLATDIQIEEDERGWLSYLDARDRDAMSKAFAEFKPDLVLHLAALVDVEECELRPGDAEVSNAVTAKIAAELAAEHGATILYISTGGVFDGTKEGHYTDDAQPHPIIAS